MQCEKHPNKIKGKICSTDNCYQNLCEDCIEDHRNQNHPNSENLKLQGMGLVQKLCKEKLEFFQESIQYERERIEEQEQQYYQIGMQSEELKMMKIQLIKTIKYLFSQYQKQYNQIMQGYSNKMEQKILHFKKQLAEKQQETSQLQQQLYLKASCSDVIQFVMQNQQNYKLEMKLFQQDYYEALKQSLPPQILRIQRDIQENLKKLLNYSVQIQDTQQQPFHQQQQNKVEVILQNNQQFLLDTSSANDYTKLTELEEEMDKSQFSTQQQNQFSSRKQQQQKTNSNFLNQDSILDKNNNNNNTSNLNIQSIYNSSSGIQNQSESQKHQKLQQQLLNNNNNSTIQQLSSIRQQQSEKQSQQQQIIQQSQFNNNNNNNNNNSIHQSQYNQSQQQQQLKQQQQSQYFSQRGNDDDEQEEKKLMQEEQQDHFSSYRGGQTTFGNNQNQLQQQNQQPKNFKQVESQLVSQSQYRRSPSPINTNNNNNNLVSVNKSYVSEQNNNNNNNTQINDGPPMLSLTPRSLGQAQQNYQVLSPNYFQQDAMPFIHYFANKGSTFGPGESYLFIYKLVAQEGLRKWEKIKIHNKISIPENHKSIVLPNGDLYLIGGKEKGKISTKIYYFDFNTQELVLQQAKIQPKIKFSLIYSRNKIYIAGGRNDFEVYKSFQAYDILNNQIQYLKDSRFETYDSTLVSVGGYYIYKIGGFSNIYKSQNCNVERYDPQKDEWTSFFVNLDPANKGHNGSLSFMGNAGAAQINNNYILVFGGKDFKKKSSRQAYLLDIGESHCKLGGYGVANMPNSCSFPNGNAFICDKEVYSIGKKKKYGYNPDPVVIFKNFNWVTF